MLVLVTTRFECSRLIKKNQHSLRRMVKKKTFKVMPFGLKNAPAFYTAMMQFLRDEWILLFNETRHIILLTNSPAKVICNDRVIIDDIFFFLTTPQLFCIIFHVLQEDLRNIGFHSSSVNKISSRIEWNASATI